MTMPSMKIDRLATAVPDVKPSPGTIVAFRPPASGAALSRVRPLAGAVAARVASAARRRSPSLLLVWQILCASPDAALPSPSSILDEQLGADRRPVLRSRRSRPGPRSGMSSPVSSASRSATRSPPSIGIALGTLIGQSTWAHARPRSDLPGAAHDPAARLAAAVARRLPRRPAVGDLRHLHHRRSGRSSSTPRSASATSRDDYRNVARVIRLNPPRVLRQDHAAGGRPLHLHRASGSASASRGSPSSPPRC